MRKRTTKCSKCKGYLPLNQVLCDFCLARKYGLTEHYDSEDKDGLGSAYFNADKVLKVLRNRFGAGMKTEEKRWKEK